MNSKKIILSAAAIVAIGFNALATNYSGNGDTGFGGAVGLGSVTVGDNGTSISFTLNRGPGNFNDALVIYIDSILGGFSSTAGFGDQADGGRGAISGVGSTMTFAAGFLPDYAISIENGFASLFLLANGGNNSLTWITGASQSGVNTSPTYSLSFNLSQIGLTAGQSLGLFGTYTATSGYRSTEAVLGNDTGTQGLNPFTQTSLVTYTTVPEPSSMVLGAAGMATLLLLRRRR